MYMQMKIKTKNVYGFRPAFGRAGNKSKIYIKNYIGSSITIVFSIDIYR